MTLHSDMNGHWVRTRTPEGAKAFFAEKEMERERREQAATRARARRAEALEWVRSTWQRLHSRSPR